MEIKHIVYPYMGYWAVAEYTDDYQDKKPLAQFTTICEALDWIERIEND